MVELSVVVPTYIERPNVGELVRRLALALPSVHWEVVFVDDDSPDGTADAVRELAQSDPRVRCLQRLGRRGLSRAVIEGVLSTSAPLIAVMDADLQHDETVLPAMLARLRGGAGLPPADLVVGSRYLQPGGVAGWDAERARMSRLACALAERWLRPGITDPMSGFFLIRRSSFDSVVRRLSGEGYKLLLDILASLPASAVVAELPYRFRLRAAGQSKLDSAVLWEYGLLLLDKRLGGRLPARFVLFSAVGLSGVGVHFAVLALAFGGLGLPFGAAQTGATLVAMTSNYALNNSLTYRDQRHQGLGWWRGLLSFYALCGLGVAANVGVATALFTRQGWAWAALAGALVGSVWNYAATRAVTWSKR
jgi:dolichol-phosphate mannosyltransferase